MKRKNVSRNALVASVISLLLCVSMLVGTTFAWFTDSVTSGVNTIAAGNLDVELYHSKDKDVEIADENKVGTDTLLFTDVNGKEIEHWEPGVVAYTNLKVANVGTLALKYQLSINSTEINYVQYADGSIYTLADALTVAVVKDGFEGGRAEVQTLDVEWKPLKSFSLPGELNSKEESDTYGIVIYWKPGENDYIFNMNNGKVTSNGEPLTITLGVNLFATQEMYENDSFGDDYDKLAPWAGKVDTEWYNETATEFTITSAEELAGLAQIVNSGKDTFTGKTVKLAANIDLNDAPWTPIGNSVNKFNGTFIGTGYTISNLYVTGSNSLGLFGCTWTSAHIEGVTIDGAYVSGSDYVGAVLGSGYLSANCIKDCTVKNAEIIATPYLMADGVTYDGGAKAGAIVGYARNGNITDCKVINCTVTAYRDLGGIAGMVSGEDRAVTVSGNTVENVTLIYLNMNGAAMHEGKVNENMGNIVGRVNNVSNKDTIDTDNTATNVTRTTDITYMIDGVWYRKNVDANTVMLFKVTDTAPEVLNIPAGVTHLGSKILSDNTTVKEVVIPASVTDFGGVANANGKGASGGMFYQSAVEKITLSEGMTEIPAAAFNQADKLTSVNIPASVEKIGINAFAGTGLETLTVPTTVKEIGYGAFRDMDKLTTATIEGEVYIPGYAFRDCSALKAVYLKGTNVTFGSDMIFTVTSTNNENPNGITVYVANDTVKESLEATNQFKGTIVVTAFVSDNDALKAAVANENATVYVSAGTYTFPRTFAEGVTLICAEDVVFTGVSHLNINGATVIGATFDATGNTNDDTGAGTQTVNGTFKDCSFTGNHGLRYCYAGETVVFEGCTFDANSRGIHFDKIEKDVYFKDCIINGFNAIGGTATITFEGCVFDASNHSYNGLNLYCNATLIDCTYNFRTGKTNFIDMEGTGKTLTITDCTVTLDGEPVNITAYIGGKLANNTVIIDGAQYVTTAAELAAAVANGATNLYLMDGEYNAYGCGGKTLTISGSKDAVITPVNEGEYGCDYGFDGATVTFNGVTIDTTGMFKNAQGQDPNYPGFARISATYNNCTFNGTYAMNRAATFTECEFNVTGDRYNLWTWGADRGTFTDCDFNCDGKSVLVYNSNCDLTFTRCTFKDNGEISDKAAIETGADYGAKTYNITLTECAVNGFDVNPKGSAYQNIVGNKNNLTADYLNVVIDGVDVY